ncbi:MAG: hypothetical protein NZ941_06230 [Candidatus Caldarchaeum sp.]|nr:hypothetical protein [Candidatus Caldarchaeum sp.]MDW7977444.1 hypothetical protein [Candidatus Caldarchaeum sp.]
MRPKIIVGFRIYGEAYDAAGEQGVDRDITLIVGRAKIITLSRGI